MCHCAAFLLDQYSMARDVNKLSLRFSCNLEGNIKASSAEKAKVSERKRNQMLILFCKAVMTITF